MVAQLLVDGKKAHLGSQSRLPGLTIGFAGPIEGPPAMTRHRLTVDTGRCNPLPISRIDEPDAIPREMSSRSDRVSVRGERRRAAGTIPPRCVNKNRMEPWPLPKAR